MQTASAAISFVLAMVKHPEIFKKAQAEIDKVVGNDRFPVLTDRESCPYLNACLTEVRFSLLCQLMGPL